jgi:gluconate 5-dehydrogenase
LNYKKASMALELFDLKGKIALITGSSQGLGMAIARGLGAAGAAVVLNGRNEDKLEEAVASFRSKGLTAHGYAFDVTDEESVAGSLEIIGKEIGGIDILVNNAGTTKRVPLLDMDLTDFRWILDIDLVSPFIVSKHVARDMIQRGGGKIINICSMMSELGRNSVGAYAAAKGGLKMLTRNMATEWAKYNIQVNGIGPGYFLTPLTKPLSKAGHPFNDFILDRTPAGRWGDPDELQGAAIFLASKASDFVNGHVLYVDGGILATIGKPHGEA